MRYDLSKVALAAALTFAPTTLVAAPNSMLNTLPRGEQAQASQPSKMGWLTKWFRGEQDPHAAVARPTGAYPPVMAYQPPQGNTPQTAWNGAGATPAMAPVRPATTPLSPPTVAMPASQPLVGSMPVAQYATPVTPSQARPQQPTAGPTAEAIAAKTKQLREQGHTLDRAGDLVAAERIYREAIAANPASAAVVNDLGLCLARQGKTEMSAAVLRQAITMRPDKPLYRNNLATVLVELGQTDEALAHLKTACRPAAAHFNLGQLLARSGQNAEAITQLQEALRLEPSLAPARDALAGLEQQSTPILTADVQPLVESQPEPTAVAPVSQYAGSLYMGSQYGASTPQHEGTQYEPVQVAAAPSPVTAPTPPPVAQPDDTGVPSFPRLLPPVLGP